MSHVKLNDRNIGFSLTIIYIVLSNLANDVFIPSSFQRLILYALLGFGVLSLFSQSINRGLCINRYSKWYIVFLGVSVITVFYSGQNRLISDSMYSMIICFLLTYIISIYIKTEKHFSAICWAWIFSSVAMAFFLIVTGRFRGTEAERLGNDLSDNANTFALGIMIACVFSIWMLIYECNNNRPKKALLFFIIILNLSTLVLSGGRKYFVIPFVFCYILLIARADKTGRKHIVKYTLIMCLIATIVSIMVIKIPVFYKAIGIRIEQLLNSATHNGDVDMSTQVREQLRETGIRGWLLSPLWGHGFDSFRYYAQRSIGLLCYSHCNYVELLYNGGIIVFSLYYSYYFSLLKEAITRNYIINKYKAFILATIISLFLFDYGGIGYNVFNVQFLLMMAGIATEIGRNINSDY